MRADTKKLMRAYLAGIPGVAPAVTVGGRLQVFGPPGLPADWKDRAIEYERLPSNLHEDLPIELSTFQVRCYGKTLAVAQQVYALVEPGLQMTRPLQVASGDETGLLLFSRVLSVDDGREPEPLNWDYVLIMAEMHWARNLQ